MGLTKAQLETLNDSSFPNNNGGLITPQVLRDYNDATIANTVNQDAYTADSASFNTRILAVTGSTTATGSFATTGSNTFVGIQNFTAAITSSANVLINGDLTVNPNTVTNLNGNANVQNFLYVGGGLTLNTPAEITWVGTSGSIGSGFSASVNARILAITGSGGGGGATTGSNTFRGDQTISYSGNNNFYISSSTGGQSNIFLQSPVGSNLTAYGQLNIGNNGGSGGSGSIKIVVNNRDIELGADSGVAIGPVNISGNGVATGAIKLLAHSGSLILSNNSFTNNTGSLLHLSSSNNTTLANFIFKANVNTGTTQISGSGNIFTNPAAPTTGRVNYVGGATNLFLNGLSQQLPQITGSAASVSGNRPTMTSNIIAGAANWTINQAPNPSSHTYSSNIIAGPGTWTFNMLGNTGNVNVNQNLGLSSQLTLNSPSRSIAEINAGASGSNSLGISTNTITGNLNYQGPVSSSTHSITQNSLAGTLNLNMQSSSRTLLMSSNIINGSATINDNTYNAGAIGSNNSIQQNNINGTFTLNQRASSSINLVNNNINTWTVSNDLDASAVTNPIFRFLQVNGNALFGLTGNNLYASGSTSAISASRGFTNNILGGQNISASLISDNSAASMIGTIGVGNGLNIEGTVTKDASNTGGNGATIGSAFFGRWNKTGQGFNTTGEVILAVGTGTSGSTGITRKTGFLIDSGSNAFFEGTLNVSGSTTMTGSLSIAPTFEVKFATGSNQQAGTAVLDGANPGTVTVSNSLVTANSIIMVSKQTLAHPNGYVAVSAKSAGSFTITSNHNGDTDTVGWFVINNS